MADYVSSYPTLWPVSDMLALCLQEREPGRERRRQKEKGGNGLTPIAPVSHSAQSHCPLCDLSPPEKVNILL